nr:MAG TPA: hypothetical protein [Caudoviricetes sp.]
MNCWELLTSKVEDNQQGSLEKRNLQRLSKQYLYLREYKE